MDNENTTAAVVEHAASDLSARKTETGPWWMRSLTLQDATIMIQGSLRQAARSVVAAGFYLKRVRDLELFRDDGLDSVWEYAGKQFGFSKTAASRYMAINDRFSVDGNSPVIRDDFKDFSRSQLQEMLYLTDQQLSEVTEDTTVRELRHMRQPDPKPEPVVNIPGQMDISDFGIGDPEECCISAAECCQEAADEAGARDGQDDFEFMPRPEETVEAKELPPAPKEHFQVTAEEMVGEEVLPQPELQEEATAVVATSQQDPVREETVREPRDSMSLWERKAGAIMELAELSGDAWSLASDPPEEPGPTMVFYRRNNPLLHDADYRAGHRTNIVDCGDHYYEVAMRWFNGKCWAGYAEEVIMWQPLPELPKMFSFGGLEKPMRIYPPDSLTATHGCGNEDCSSCAEALCQARAEYRWCRHAPCGKPFGCTTMNVVESIRADKIKGCQFADLSLAAKRAGDGRPAPCCMNCKGRSSCGYACSRARMTDAKEKGQPGPPMQS